MVAEHPDQVAALARADADRPQLPGRGLVERRGDPGLHGEKPLGERAARVVVRVVPRGPVPATTSPATTDGAIPARASTARASTGRASTGRASTAPASTLPASAVP